MAVPAALFIKRFSCKLGILTGLTLHAAGCLLFIPSGNMMAFWAFLLSYFIMTCGLSFLETSANPCILAMGDETTATRRLNLAQAFNPLGSLTGMPVAKEIILAKLNPASEDARRELLAADPGAFAKIPQGDLGVIVWPYALLGIVVLVVLVVFALAKLPKAAGEDDRRINAGATLGRLLRNKRYLGGVIAQAFHVGAQIRCWTFIIRYGVNELSMTKETAMDQTFAALSSTRVSFFLPFLCFVAIASYGIRTYRIRHEHGEQAAEVA